jgi:hypothetical protein
MAQLITPYTLTIAAITFILAVIYAIRIAFIPFRDHLTWLSVVIGDSLTDAFSSLVIYHLTGDIWLAALPWIAHTITGGPMITGQVVKWSVFRIKRKRRQNHDPTS